MNASRHVYCNSIANSTRMLYCTVHVILKDAANADGVAPVFLFMLSYILHCTYPCCLPFEDTHASYRIRTVLTLSCDV